MKPISSIRNFEFRRLLCAGSMVCAGLTLVHAAEPLPLSTSYWKDPAFRKAFNGSYRIEARIEPTLGSEERGLLVRVQELMAQGKRDAALKALQDSELTAKSAALTFNLGNLLFESGETEKAIESYQKAIEDYPSFRRAHRNLAMAYVRLEEWDKALASLKEAVRLGDSEGMTYGLLGYCRLAREEYASALQAYRLAQLTEPDVAEWSAGIAQCLQQLDQREEAIALLDEVIRKRPLEPSYSVLKANIHLQLQQDELAAKALEMPYRLGHLGVDTSLLLAELHLRAQRLEVAEAVMESAFADADNPPSESAVLRLFELAVAQQEWDWAKRLLERLPDKQQGRPLRLAKAKYWIASDQDPQAGAKLLRQLVQEDPTDGEALLGLADHLAQSGQPAAAALQYERAAVDPDVAFAAYHGLTRLHASQSRYQAALEALDHALQIRSDEALERYRKALRQALEASR
ncbi:MAG: tetratricopeptide repeat protein [Akkermansiaceae bacterium]|nr:tetratricopeptide repeat protein [Akkermansiaceae bacterium]